MPASPASDGEGARPLDALAGRARARHVVVAGGGIAGLVAALECAKVGMRVTLLEREDRLGGLIRDAELDGMRLELGATAAAGGVVRQLADDVGLGAAVTAPETDATWLGGLPGGALPFPAATVLGIPANPFVDDVRRVIGWRGAWRAYVDRLRPPLTIGRERSLGRLVATRMGPRVRDRLVASLSEGVYGIAPELIDVDAAAPGLNPALTRTGSLSGAASELLAPPKPLETVAGGLSRLVEALGAQLRAYDVDIRTGTPVVGLRRAPSGWTVDVEPEPDADPDGAEGAALAADAVVVALPAGAARALLASAVPDLPGDAPPAVAVDLVALVADAPALDAVAPRARTLTVPGTGPVAAVEHESARWAWLRGDAAHGRRHALRVRFAPGAADALADPDAGELARREASALLGADIPPGAVRAAERVRLSSAAPATVLGHGAFAEAMRTALSAHPGLAVTGAWVAGTGLAAVVPHARGEAERVRRVLLWGASPPAS